MQADVLLAGDADLLERGPQQLQAGPAAGQQGRTLNLRGLFKVYMFILMIRFLLDCLFIIIRFEKNSLKSVRIRLTSKLLLGGLKRLLRVVCM